jgi:hypothetical protein
MGIFADVMWRVQEPWGEVCCRDIVTGHSQWADGSRVSFRVISRKRGS